MSILIKGIEMPTDDFIRIILYPNGRAVKANAVEYEEFEAIPVDFIPCWIPVTEQMPYIMRPILVTGKMKYDFEKKYTRFVDLGWYDSVSFDTCNDWYEGQQEFEITHWMPLPQPFKGDD